PCRVAKDGEKFLRTGKVLNFFLQAEDGIRDGHVTGVQTCALPISQTPQILGHSWKRLRICGVCVHAESRSERQTRRLVLVFILRSEERRVGKECRSGGLQNDEKRNNKKVKDRRATG